MSERLFSLEVREGAGWTTVLWWIPLKIAEAAFPRRDQDLICKTNEQLEAFFFFLRKMTINMQRVPDAKKPFPNSRALLALLPSPG